MSLDQKSAKIIANSSFEFFRTNDQSTIQLPCHSDLEGYLVTTPEQRKIVQIRLLKTNDQEKQQVYPITWKRLETKALPSCCPTILETGEQNGIPYYVSELPEGEPVSQFIHKGEPMPPTIAAELTAQFLEELLKHDPLMYQVYSMNPESIWLAQSNQGQPQIQFGDYTIDPTDNAEAGNYQLCLDLLKYLCGNPPFDQSFQQLSALVAEGPANLQNLLGVLHQYLKSNPADIHYWNEQNRPNSILKELIPNSSYIFETESVINEPAMQEEAVPEMPIPTEEPFFDLGQAMVEPEPYIEDTYLDAFDPSLDQHTEVFDLKSKWSFLGRLSKPFFTLLAIIASIVILLFCITGGNLSRIKAKIPAFNKKPSEIETNHFRQTTVDKPTAEILPPEAITGAQNTHSDREAPIELPFPQRMDTSSPSSTAYQPETISIPTKLANSIDVFVDKAAEARTKNDYVSAINSELIHLENTPNSKAGINRVIADIAALKERQYSFLGNEIEIIKQASKVAPQAYELLITHFRDNKMLEDEVAALVDYSKTAGPSKLAEAGQRLMTNESATESDKSRALQFYLHAADANDAVGQFYAGESLILGLSGTVDKSQGASYLSQAVNQGHHPSMDLLGVCYVRGWGVSQDDTKAIELFKTAISQGNTDAYLNLGARYAEGDQPNLSLAGETFELGAEKGNIDCMFVVARCYLAGYGRPQNEALAKEWFKRAAILGNSDAIHWCNNNQINLNE